MEKKYPCDYYVKAPKHISNMDYNQQVLENKLKNVAMRIILDIRERRKKPKLRDFIELYRTNKHKEGAKEEFQKKFRMFYDTNLQPAGEGEDEKFDRMMSNFDRIQRQLTQQQQALSHVVTRINNLGERRERKEQRIQSRLNKPIEKEKKLFAAKKESSNISYKKKKKKRKAAVKAKKQASKNEGEQTSDENDLNAEDLAQKRRE